MPCTSSQRRFLGSLAVVAGVGAAISWGSLPCSARRSWTRLPLGSLCAALYTIVTRGMIRERDPLVVATLYHTGGLIIISSSREKQEIRK